jgi:hypothetical protein
MSIEAMKLALEALDIACRKYGEVGSANTDWGRWDSAMTALRAAIEHAEKQEPVAWIKKDKSAIEVSIMSADYMTNEGFEPLYTAPPQREWQGLTDEEYVQIMQEADRDAAKTGSVFRNLHRAIEAKLKEKNA